LRCRDCGEEGEGDSHGDAETRREEGKKRGAKGWLLTGRRRHPWVVSEAEGVDGWVMQFPASLGAGAPSGRDALRGVPI